MPYLLVNDTKLFYNIYGSGDQTLVFSHGFLLSSKMFQPIIDSLKSDYTILAYDHRGQGQSETSETGYDIDSYTEDAHTIITELCDGPVHFAGLSTGGFVGMRLALQYPELISSLILLNTSAAAATGFKRMKFRVLRIVVRLFGFRLVTGQIMKALFGKQFLTDPDREEEVELWRERIQANDILGAYRAFDAAVYRDDITDKISAITQPTLIIGGTEDKGLSPEESTQLHDLIPNSELILLDNVGHSSTIEAPQQVEEAIRDFLVQL